MISGQGYLLQPNPLNDAIDVFNRPALLELRRAARLQPVIKTSFSRSNPVPRGQATVIRPFVRRRQKATNNKRSRATGFLPTSNPSPVSGRLGHQKVHRERSRTPRVNPRHLEASRSIFSSQCMQNRHRTMRSTQTFISSKTRRITLSVLNTKTFGGAERDRTADPLLAKQVLSQLSYSPIQVSIPAGCQPILRWWARADSNCRPHAYQACALTT